MGNDCDEEFLDLISSAANVFILDSDPVDMYDLGYTRTDNSDILTDSFDNESEDICVNNNACAHPCKSTVQDYKKKVSKLDSDIIYIRDKDGDNLLHIAIILENVCLAFVLIEFAATPSWISFANKLFQTPLHLAVLTKRVAIVKKLLTSGADVMARDNNGNTPFGLACRDGLSEIVFAILRSLSTASDASASYQFKQTRRQRLFRLLNYEGLTCIHLAAMNGHLHIVKILVNYDVDVNMKEGKTGRAILHNSCISGDVKLVKLLLNHRKCNINARSYDGLTPFDLARIRQHDDVCMLLAAAGARYGTDDDIDSD